ncbi:homoserine dehydrogenase [Clostridium sp.]|uniref:homoserine dehydrogenase n=1 Tax=Clostridium sp. TaxID=1506 RepID=UPI003D6D83FB
MRIALVGFGGVGKAFVKLLTLKYKYLAKKGLNIKLLYVLSSKGGIYNPNGIDLANLIEFLKDEKDITKYPHGGDSNVTFSSILNNKDIDLLVEMTPTNRKTGEPGMTHITNALNNKIHVVTANKGPILLGYNKLKKIALKNNVQLGIGCTTGGALPTINSGMIDMAGATISSIEGVLNGTTNFITNYMELHGTTYETALHEAQKIGIAEKDPCLDVDGWDTAIKLVILTNVLMNKEMTLNDVLIEGITNLTKTDVANSLIENKKYKLIGRTINTDDTIHMSVKLEKLDITNPLYNVDGKNKGVRYISDTLGDLTLIGGASGVIPAAASVLRDIINIHDGYKFIK